jgi:hypothetical protein
MKSRIKIWGNSTQDNYHPIYGGIHWFLAHTSSPNQVAAGGFEQRTPGKHHVGLWWMGIIHGKCQTKITQICQTTIFPLAKLRDIYI